MFGAKLILICPGNEINRELHQKIDRKKRLLYENELPARVMKELRLEVSSTRAKIQNQVLAASKVS
jgi:hypothetical protein